VRNPSIRLTMSRPVKAIRNGMPVGGSQRASQGRRSGGAAGYFGRAASISAATSAIRAETIR
jgi:hypothetical protein